MNALLVDEATRRDVEDFLFLEARLLDARDFEAWLELWDDDACYWVPNGRPDVDPRRAISIVHDDRAGLADRVFRMLHPAAHAQDPPSSTARVVSNVEVAPADHSLTVHSAYVLVANRRGEQAVFGARVEHRLIRHEDGLRMAFKKVDLTAVDDALRNLTFLP